MATTPATARGPAALQLILLIVLLGSTLASSLKVQHKVRCSEDAMVIEVIRSGPSTVVYLENLKDYPDTACKPNESSEGGGLATFSLSFSDIFRCGLTRVHNSATGRNVYYHRVIVEERSSGTNIDEGSKQIISVKCVVGPEQVNATRTRRNVLPAGFQEPEELEITKTLTIKAPEPQLRVAVRQAGRLVTGELNVSPGTALQMELGLDPASAPVYGLLVSHMQVSDTRTQEETIIFNGCSVDPYLFENFNTVDGDFLTAKFRAFKFPESTYVQFKGTVNVCLDKCRGVECSNGQTGYGRRRRAVSELPPDSNKVFEITMSTFFKVDYEGEQLMEKGKLSSILEPFANKTEDEVSQKLEVVEQETIEGEVLLQGTPRAEQSRPGGLDHHRRGHHHHQQLQLKSAAPNSISSLPVAMLVLTAIALVLRH